MLKSLFRLREIFAFAGKKNISLQHKLMIYLISIVLSGIALLTIIMIAVGMMPNEDLRLREKLRLQESNVDIKLSAHVDNIMANAVRLSEQLSDAIEQKLLEEGKDFEDLNDNPELLAGIQKTIFPKLNTALRLSDASGAYVILEATSNTKIDGAKNFRSGMHIKFANINTGNSIDAGLVYLRGIPDIAREEAIELHNRWDLEFDISSLSAYGSFFEEGNPGDEYAYIWTKKLSIKDTWEKVLLLLVPIYDSRDKFIGVCGMEVSELYFRHYYPSVNSDLGSICTMLMPISEGGFKLGEGMLGEKQGIYISDTAKLSIDYRKYVNYYSSDDGEGYVGLQKLLDISDKEQWFLITLISRDSYERYIITNRIKLILVIALFLIIMLILSLVMSKKFVKPILQSLDDIKSGAAGTDIRITELDELIAFLKKKDNGNKDRLPVYIEEMLANFKKRIGNLDDKERKILSYYEQKYEITDIVESEYITIDELRLINQGIYEKLGLTSKDELMIYIDLFRSLGRIDEVIYQDMDIRYE